MVDGLPDETLVEVILLESIITDRGASALVMLVPHIAGEQCDETIPPAVVPANWFSKLMPASLFMDIPDDISSIAPVLEVDSDRAGLPAPSAQLGMELALRWRANGRPIATTVQFVADCYAVTPPHLFNQLLDVLEIFKERRFNKTNRGHIITFLELMSRRIAGNETVANDDN